MKSAPLWKDVGSTSRKNANELWREVGSKSAPVPVKCPKCESDEIDAGEWWSDPNAASCIVRCSSCGLKWAEYYKADSWEVIQ